MITYLKQKLQFLPRLFLLFTLCITGTSVALADSPNSTPERPTELIGAGASFPYPVYSKWANSYEQNHGIRVNYQSIGSGGGVKQIKKGLVDFGASDYPLTQADLDKNNLFQFPAVGGGIVLSANLGDLSDKLVLDGPTVAQIYLGKINKWNDPRIQALNPTLNLPDIYIAVLFRSDGSGTTYNFTKFLATVSPEFAHTLGYSKAVNFPVGLGGKGNEGVAAVLPRVYGAIGYLEFGYAESLHLGAIAMKNSSGEIVHANLETFSNAIKAADWSTTAPNVSNLNAPDVWPINAISFVLVHKDSPMLPAVHDFFAYGMLTQTAETKTLDYVPLANNIAQKLLDSLLASQQAPKN